MGSYNSICEGPMGPLTTGCSIKLGITGEANNDNINYSVQTAASDDMFKVTASENNKKAYVAKVDYNNHDLYELSFNNMAVQGAQQVGAMIGQARVYVNELTDPKKGGKDFNKWYKSIYA